MVFRLTDRNKDGNITAEELKRMLLDKLDIQVDDSLIGDLMTSAGENGTSLVVFLTASVCWTVRPNTSLKEHLFTGLLYMRSMKH